MILVEIVYNIAFLYITEKEEEITKDSIRKKLYLDNDQNYFDIVDCFINIETDYSWDDIINSAIQFINENKELLLDIVLSMDDYQTNRMKFFKAYDNLLDLIREKSELMTKFPKLTIGHGSQIPNYLAASIGVKLEIYQPNLEEYDFDPQDKYDCIYRACTYMTGNLCNYKKVRKKITKINHKLGAAPNSTAGMEIFLSKYGFIDIMYALQQKDFNNIRVYDLINSNIAVSKVIVGTAGHVFAFDNNTWYDTYPVLSCTDFVNQILISDITNFYISIACDYSPYTDEIKFQYNALTDPKYLEDNGIHPETKKRMKIIRENLDKYLKDNDLNII